MMRIKDTFRAGVAALALALGASAQAPLVPAGATWRYLDDGSDQGTAWYAPSFDDSSWALGPAELGYGDGDEATVVSYGPLASAKYATTYFRRAFTVGDLASLGTPLLRLLRDDGAVVYLNGVELLRDNIALFGAVTYDQWALAPVGGAEESAWRSFALSAELFQQGTNVLAVEVHQAAPTSSDVSFDLELAPDGDVALLRGPYLQRGTSSEVTLRWRTDVHTQGRVRYGLAPDALTSVADGPWAVDHEIRVSGLAPDTRYYYAVGFGAAMLAGGDAEHTLLTAPAPGTMRPLRIWALGDSGTADAVAAAVRDAYDAYPGALDTDLWLMLGDNAYLEGTDEQYQAAVFDMYPAMLRRSVLWPARGNHDLSASTYYKLFTLPAAGEAGGVPSGSEAYYSFDFGNVHFICLDSFGSSKLPGDPMYAWLEADLAANDQDWTIAFWHHPPYSKGSHDSDVEGDLVLMRAIFLPLLEDHGVDLVLSGHSHSYERSYLIDGHYGFSSEFSDAHKQDPGDGRESGDGAYHKAPIPGAGAVYCVAGSSGKTSPAPLGHPAMVYAAVSLGSLVIDVDEERLDVRFLRETGAVDDHFTIFTYPGAELTAPSTTASISLAEVQTLALDAGPSHAGNGYLVLGSLTGTAPPMPLGPLLVPLVFDPYSNFTVTQAGGSIFPATLGVLDAQGRASASIQIAAVAGPSHAGTTAFHAFVAWDAGAAAFFVLASNAFPLTLLP